MNAARPSFIRTKEISALAPPGERVDVSAAERGMRGKPSSPPSFKGEPEGVPLHCRRRQPRGRNSIAQCASAGKESPNSQRQGGTSSPHGESGQALPCPRPAGGPEGHPSGKVFFHLGQREDRRIVIAEAYVFGTKRARLIHWKSFPPGGLFPK